MRTKRNCHTLLPSSGHSSSLNRAKAWIPACAGMTSALRRRSVAERILQVSFQFQAARAVYERAVASIADAVDAVPGLRWKLWLLNADQREAGGIYLFADEL